MTHLLLGIASLIIVINMMIMMKAIDNLERENKRIKSAINALYNLIVQTEPLKPESIFDKLKKENTDE